ncbi:MAG: hypothetical protein UW84_C0007G0013 [Candidatus Collierbacteria bacterium GW2011_GWA2_44_99]|uniref:Uncharacterized protein n=1 Tax=Candidatus Collierbacteria bacterium GW2011_GWA2_44_99 TaxID=1618380 RepID=A0A0G1NQZ6_9BACT|nr:MAG: hypothetical protein UW84_C0007G0013 [Candidatus Collierbacteria bacterium GW2011_GWA2_44_99]
MTGKTDGPESVRVLGQDIFRLDVFRIGEKSNKAFNDSRCGFDRELLTNDRLEKVTEEIGGNL